jgi:arylsulfatase A-like enzyme
MNNCYIILSCLFSSLVVSSCGEAQQKEQPNIILIMADDLGYGDLGYMGNDIVQTPHLDALAGQGIRFNRFYAAAPVCSPTRASCLTGRHPYRSGIPWAGRYALPSDEITLAKVLQENGYTTAHFGKWHIGGMSRQIDQSHFPDGPTPYAPPWEHGFDVAFSTESMVPLYNPYYHVGGEYGRADYRHVQNEPVASGQQTGGHQWKNLYWTGPGQFVDENLEGSNATLIMDRALAFMQEERNAGNPFFTLVWFHTPHTPVVAGDEYRELYPGQTMEAQHWFGSITTMDEQIGRLFHALADWGIADETIVWFKSDNGPSYIHGHNSAGPLRGAKGELYEGGIRVPSILHWPVQFPDPKVINEPISTSDLFPTVMAMAGVDHQAGRTIDGENVLPVISHGKSREGPIAFASPLPNRLQPAFSQESEQFAIIEGRYKLISMDNRVSYQLYDLDHDISESQDLAGELKDISAAMQNVLEIWIRDVREDASRLQQQ